MQPINTKLDWNLLHTFYVIAEEKGITRAAETLGVKQPSVSAALQRLEDALGCRLIVRASRRFELTKHGEILHRECGVMYRTVARINEKLAGADSDITGAVRVLAVTDVRYSAFDQCLRALHQKYPSIRVQIDIVSSQESVRAISRQLAPAALCLLAQPIAGLNCRHLVREEFGIFCGQSHPLFGRSDVDLSLLRDQNFVSFSCISDGGVLEPMLALGADAGFGANLRGSSTHLSEVVRMILAGVGIGILPVESVRREVDEGLLWRLSPPDVSLGADLYLVTNPAMPLELAEAAFLDVFNTCITDDQRERQPRAEERSGRAPAAPPTRIPDYCA